MTTLLIVAALAFSAWYSWAAPCGIFGNRIFGTSAWSEADPGAWYVYAAYQLGSGDPPIYHGHPGTPLRLVLAGIQHAYDAVAAPAGFTRGRFLAQHLPQLFWLSKMATTVLHLASFWLIYRFACAVLDDRRAAWLAALGYATSFPVLYYLSRISPEPVAIGCVAGAFLAFWRYECVAARSMEAGNSALPRALGWLTLAGAAAVTGAVAKLQLAAPVPVLLFAMVLTDFPRRLSARAPLEWRPRIAACAAFTASTAATLAFYSIWIDWKLFFGYWLLLPSVRSGPKPLDPADLLPGFSASNLLPTAEIGFAIVALAGFVIAIRTRPALRGRVLTIGAYAAFGAVLLAYRVGIRGSFLPFHYAFAALLGAAPFFGFALARWERRLHAERNAWSRAAFALGAIALIHGVGIAAVVGSRQLDASRFAPNRAGYVLIEGLGPNEVLWVEDGSAPTTRVPPEALPRRVEKLAGWSARGILGIASQPPHLREAFESIFRPMPRRVPDALRVERVRVPWLRGNLVVAR